MQRLQTILTETEMEYSDKSGADESESEEDVDGEEYTDGEEVIKANKLVSKLCICRLDLVL